VQAVLLPQSQPQPVAVAVAVPVAVALECGAFNTTTHVVACLSTGQSQPHMGESTTSLCLAFYDYHDIRVPIVFGSRLLRKDSPKMAKQTSVCALCKI